MNESLPPPRLLAVVAPVCAAGLVVICAGCVVFAFEPHKTTMLVGLIALLAASTLADRFPVPVEGLDTSGVSLSFVFGVASIVLFGWAAGLLVVVLPPAITQVLEQRPRMRIAYNVSVLALAATAAGALLAPISGHDSASGVFARVGVAASCAVHRQPRPDHGSDRRERAASLSSQSPASTSAGRSCRSR